MRYKRRLFAKNGRPGGGNNCTGADAADIIVRVPVGTEIYDDETGELLADLTEPEERFVIAPGGKGGWGNTRFANASRRSPDFAKPGRPGAEHELRLVLKLLADVGLVGFPNAGKSTLVSRISRARPKVADYPFTTLRPNLGVVHVADDRSYVVADLPGLIEGAADGHGLGHQFLRHIERTALFLFLVTQDLDPARNPLADYRALRNELERYDPALLTRPHVVVLSQCDRPEVAEQLEALRDALPEVQVLSISAVTGDGLPALTRYVSNSLLEAGRWG